MRDTHATPPRGSQTYEHLRLVIGDDDATLRLLRECGGTEITLTRGVTRTSSAQRAAISEIIGDVAYQRLLDHFGVGARIPVPLGKHLVRAWEIAEAGRMVESGMDYNAVALRMRRTKRWVERVTKTVPQVSQAQAGRAITQGTLF